MYPVLSYVVMLAMIQNTKIILLHAVAPLGTTGQAVLSFCLPKRQVKEIEHENMEDVIQKMSERL